MVVAAKAGAQNLGVPFFRNFTATEYNGHNRNTDIVCDSTGRVYVANFEGLLVYDGVEWTMHHTPGISRVTSIYKAKDGKVWFGGNNVVGTVTTADSISLQFISDEKDSKMKFGEVTTIEERNGKIYFTTNEDKLYRIDDSKITVRRNENRTNTAVSANINDIAETVTVADLSLIAVATKNQGIYFTDKNRNLLYSITKDNGLCSNSINAIAYDGKGSVWGATDNGLFRIGISRIFTHYGEDEGLPGQVTSIMAQGNSLYVGTLQGLYKLENNQFRNIGITNQACWQMIKTNDNTILAATVDGVFAFGTTSRHVSKKHTLAVCQLNDGTILTGELDGIYSYKNASQGAMTDKVPNVVKFEKDDKGGVWAITLYNETYYRAASASHFMKKENKNLSLLFNYQDNNGNRWHSSNNGIGLECDGMPENMKTWLRPLNDHIVQTMAVDNGVAWIGGTYGLIRFDTNVAKNSQPYTPEVYMRNFTLDDNNVLVYISNDKADVVGKTMYSYRLHRNDNWTAWRTDNDLYLENLAYGRYQLTVRSRDAFGYVATSKEVAFEIPYPIYLRWYAMLFYLFLLSLLFYVIARYRMRRLEKEQERLENIVDERTRELKTAQKQLIRKEREATVGKLTKGLIDRILNPMNYINNFSHLSLGLTKDLQDNLDDINDNVNSGEEVDKEEFEELYEDSVDVIDMMKQNLDKIEQHGMATTRILKAMEEMLKDRSGTRTSTDIGALCQQNYEMLCKYYAEDIEKYGISIEWSKPAESIKAMTLAEQISRTVMSIIANSIYAIRKKSEKLPAAIYKPVLRMTLTATAEHFQIKIYDNGIGIEESIIDKVFDPFFTTKPTAEASGVGLYLCQQIVQDHGGTISIDSIKDEYTEATLVIPRE